MSNALHLALEALEYHTAQTRPIERTQQAIAALRDAIEQKPWGWAIVDKNGNELVTRPRKREFFGDVTHEQPSWEPSILESCAKDLPGLAPFSLVTLYASPQPAAPQPDLSLLNRSLGQRNMRQHTDMAEALKQAANVISEDGTIIAHMKKKAAPQPVAVPDDAAAEIIALVKEFGRASDEVGRSRQSNCYAMNTGAVVKACRLEDEIERAVKKLAALAAAPQAPSREPLSDAEITEATWHLMLSDYRDGHAYDIAVGRAVLDAQAKKDGITKEGGKQCGKQ